MRLKFIYGNKPIRPFFILVSNGALSMIIILDNYHHTTNYCTSLITFNVEENENIPCTDFPNPLDSCWHLDLSGCQLRTPRWTSMLYQKAPVTGELQQPFKLQSIYLTELQPHCVKQGNSTEQARLLITPSCSLRMSVVSAFTGESIHFKGQTK